jgi:hypothetical protein
MNKNKIVLLFLFLFPIITYLIFASAKHNSLFLNTISKNNTEVPSHWESLNNETVRLHDKITVLGFVGNNVFENKTNLFNLNQKIYNKYFGFKDFQFIMVAPEGTEQKCKEILEKFKLVADDLSGWHFVFASENEIVEYYQTFNLERNLDEHSGTSYVILIDKERNHRGRIGKNKKGEQEYRESYNTMSAADLHNEMTDDVKILLREYRLALKKNKRKDSFRDKITDEIEKNQKLQ